VGNPIQGQADLTDGLGGEDHLTVDVELAQADEETTHSSEPQHVRVTTDAVSHVCTPALVFEDVLAA
jgi:hypothetical protein